MNYIELMMQEHINIKRMLKVVRKYCYRILKGETVEYRDFDQIIDFIRNYADKHHHGKEEDFLFSKMAGELGPTAEKLVRHGMLVEHDLGRMYIYELEAAVRKALDGEEEAKLDVIANAISYTHLLDRHIDKEDQAVYRFAQANLPQASLQKLEDECKKHEENQKQVGEKYLSLLQNLEAKVKDTL